MINRYMQPAQLDLNMEFYTPNMQAWMQAIGQQQQQFDAGNAAIAKLPDAHWIDNQGVQAYAGDMSNLISSVTDAYTKDIAQGRSAMAKATRQVASEWGPGGRAYNLEKHKEGILAEQEKIEKAYTDPTVRGYQQNSFLASVNPIYDSNSTNWRSTYHDMPFQGAAEITPDKKVQIFNSIADNIKATFIRHYQGKPVSFDGVTNWQAFYTEHGVSWDKALNSIANAIPEEMVQYAQLYSDAYGYNTNESKSNLITQELLPGEKPGGKTRTVINPNTLLGQEIYGWASAAVHLDVDRDIKTWVNYGARAKKERQIDAIYAPTPGAPMTIRLDSATKNAYKADVTERQKILDKLQTLKEEDKSNSPEWHQTMTKLRDVNSALHGLDESFANAEAAAGIDTQKLYQTYVDKHTEIYEKRLSKLDKNKLGDLEYKKQVEYLNASNNMLNFNDFLLQVRTGDISGNSSPQSSQNPFGMGTLPTGPSKTIFSEAFEEAYNQYKKLPNQIDFIKTGEFTDFSSNNEITFVDDQLTKGLIEGLYSFNSVDGTTKLDPTSLKQKIQEGTNVIFKSQSIQPGNGPVYGVLQYYDTAEEKTVTLHGAIPVTNGPALNEARIIAYDKAAQDAYSQDKYEAATDHYNHVAAQRIATEVSSYNPNLGSVSDQVDMLAYDGSMKSQSVFFDNYQVDFKPSGSGIIGEIKEYVPPDPTKGEVDGKFVPVMIKNEDGSYTPQKLTYSRGGNASQIIRNPSQALLSIGAFKLYSDNQRSQ